jgi:hypothetical protein
MFDGSIGFAFSSAAGFAGDLPASGVFFGSVCAFNEKATAKLRNETKSDFFILESKDGRLARNVQSANNE